MTLDISFQLNGEPVTVAVDPAATLLHVIRDQIGLKGTKEGCTEGECGACSVLIDDKPVDSCIYAAVQADGASVRTVEGLGASKAGAALSDAFVAAGGIQCGFCTPGFVVTLTALLERRPNPAETEVKTALAGNICRCTGYSQILDSVSQAVAKTEAS